MSQFLPTILPIVIAFITGVLGPSAVQWIKSRFEKKSVADLVVDAIECGTPITQKIDQIREEVKADRVWISHFHNGGHFYPTGKSIAKFSIHYESVSAGIKSINENFQNIPVSLFNKSFNELLQKDLISIVDFTDPECDTYGLNYSFDSCKSKSLYLFAIKDLSGKYIATLGVDFTKQKKQLDMDTIHHISKHASTIGGVLMTYLTKKS